MITPRSRMPAPRRPPMRSAFAHQCARNPPTSAGVFNSSGRYMPSAKISAGTPSISMMSAIAAPAPNNMYATGWWLMKPSTSAFMMEAWGGQHGADVARRCLAELERARQHYDGEARRDGRREHPDELGLLLAAGVEPSQ